MIHTVIRIMMACTDFLRCLFFGVMQGAKTTVVDPDSLDLDPAFQVNTDPVPVGFLSDQKFKKYS